ncbi:MAG: DarT ssDNA thymidine ADP-ribosyltransferase family protein [Phycisphaerales bacterium]
MSGNLAIRRRDLESAIRSGTELARAASSRLEQAEELLEAAYEELDPEVDRDPRFLAAQSRYEEVAREVARRRGGGNLSSVAAGVEQLVAKFGPLVGTRQSNCIDLTRLSESELRAEARAAYRGIASVRREIAAAGVADYARSVDHCRAAAVEARDRLDALNRELVQLGADEQRQAAEAGARLMTEVQREVSITTAAQVPAQGIEGYARQRGIAQLVHFTRLENLPGILRHGLIPRAELEADGSVAAVFNDEYRLERRRDCSCLSISRINYKMFHKYSRQADWCILHIDVSLLWKQKSIFCETNAASFGAVQRAEGFGWSGEGLAQLFKDPVQTPQGAVHRASLIPWGLPSNETSDPQAEVLVHGRVSPDCIHGVAFRRDEDLQEMKRHLLGNRVQCYVDASQFGPRKDYAFWKRAIG